MRIFTVLIGILTLTACSSMERPLLDSNAPMALTARGCTSVASVKANAEGCAGRSIQIKAYLISTRHGEYLADTPEDSEVLSVKFSELQPQSESVSDLLEKLTQAGIGHPNAQLYGVFEGRLVVRKVEQDPKFEIYSEIQ